ncbi:MAG: T9SS type A sorting domain-containing protein [Dyadobacter sp.]|uniref:choice-of-anchor Q domain-containing protein n=1 Tax=Dyadobacter sp. TaxID=1914288 RepID=UPI001B11493F|nr:choice-of-anchor Q domain-containing protein [Dyadobacter sp.]MBO9616518.1 T9SS type A sorting domain-containing protein [Dyadobacter sp.]
MEKLLQIISIGCGRWVNGHRAFWTMLVCWHGIAFLHTTASGQGISPDGNNILYVDINVNTGAGGYTGAGNSWANAVPQLADALKWAREEYAAGDHGWSSANPLRIFVAKGKYLPAYHLDDRYYTTNGGRNNGFVMVRDVQLYGGFDPAAGIEDLDDARILPNVATPGQGTVLSGDLAGNDSPDNFENHAENVRHVVLAGGTVGAGSIDGFTISGGKADDSMADMLAVNGQFVMSSAGGGMYLANSSLSVKNNLFYRNMGVLGGGALVFGSASEPVFSHCTFHSNAAETGGGAGNFTAAPTFNDCAFSDNTSSSSGGGAGNVQSNSSFTDCRFTGNTSDAGGGMGNQGSNPTITNTNFIENSARNGGAMLNGGGLITLNGCEFLRNSVEADGGGLFNGQTQVSFSKCIFEGNRADQRGGAMRNDRATVAIRNSRITANNSIQGGGIINEGCPSILLVNSIVSENTAQMAGGMMSGVSESVVVANCTFWGNVSEQSGGGALLNFQAPLSLTNTIIWDNEAIGAGNSAEASIFIAGDQLPVVTNSLVANWGGSDNWSDLRGVDGGGNIDIDPAFASVTPTDANFLDLTDLSPARDAGSNSAYTTAGGNLANDKDFAGSPRSFGTSVDMGAYENQHAQAVMRVLYVDAAAGDDSADGISWPTAFKTFSHALSVANADTDVDTILVAKGTYYPTGIASGTNRAEAFHIGRGGIKIFGGYDAGTGQRNLAANRTILSGGIGDAGAPTDNSYHVMVIAGIPADSDSIEVNGFVVTDSYTDGGGSTRYNGVDVAQNYGGGIYTKQNGLGSKLRLANLIIRNNYANYAAGIFNDEQSSPLVVNCQITGNAAAYNGGGMLNRNGSSPQIINCTIAGNEADDGAGIFNNINASPSIHNSIVYGNRSGISNYGGSNPTLTYSLVQGQPVGSGNLPGAAIPGFIAPAGYDLAPTNGGDYRLQACSPALNKGNNSLFPGIATLDANGDTRIAHLLVDLGAFEHQGTLPTAADALAKNGDQSSRTVTAVTDFWANDEACRLVARLEPTGNTPLSGSVTGRVDIDAEVAFHKGSPYVQRHYLFNGPAGGSARMTLYFTQAEFDRFNLELPSGPLPGNATDEVHKSNLRVFQYEGTAGSKPGDFQGAPSVIDPDDANIRWHEALQRWEVSFTIEGFSGFFIGSIASPLPVKLVSFAGAADPENAVTLDWRVVEQENITAYGIQYSTNSRDFQHAGTVPATQASEASYTFRHHPPLSSAQLYYRLLISEGDGSQSFSKIISLKIQDLEHAFVYPNPASEGFRIKRRGVAGTTASLVNMGGINLKTWRFRSDEEYLDVRSLPAGVYFIRFNDGTYMKVVKN